MDAKDTPVPGRVTPTAPVNIEAVAAAAGVSKTTVSHVISGKRPVSAATRRKVEKVMADLGYRPNYFARALRSGASDLIALIAQDLTNPFYPTLARGVQQAVSAHRKAVMLFDAAGAGDLVHTFVRDAVARRVDGLVIAVPDMEEDLDVVREAGVPVVAVGTGLSGLPIDWVSADDEAIARDAVAHLADAGHTRIAVVAGPTDLEPAAGRLRGYRDAMAARHLPVHEDWVVTCEWTREAGEKAAARLLDGGLTSPPSDTTAAGSAPGDPGAASGPHGPGTRAGNDTRSTSAAPDRPTALFCANDLLAIGAMDAVTARGLDIPGDVAVIGVDDIDAASLVRPALSTMRIPAQEIGRAAGDLLLRRIASNTQGDYCHICLPHAFVARDSL